MSFQEWRLLQLQLTPYVRWLVMRETHSGRLPSPSPPRIAARCGFSSRPSRRGGRGHPASELEVDQGAVGLSVNALDSSSLSDSGVDFYVPDNCCGLSD
jgi:hypothetical protein